MRGPQLTMLNPKMCEFYSKEVTERDPKTGETRKSTRTGDKKRDCGQKNCPTSSEYKKW